MATKRAVRQIDGKEYDAVLRQAGKASDDFSMTLTASCVAGKWAWHARMVFDDVVVAQSEGPTSVITLSDLATKLVEHALEEDPLSG